MSGARVRDFATPVPASAPRRCPRRPSTASQPKGTVWVVNRDRGELAIFDAETGRVLKTLPVGAGAHDICISERAGKAYITAETINRSHHGRYRDAGDGIDPVGPLPHHIEPSHDGRTIYVSLASHTPAVGAPQCAAIDTETTRSPTSTTSNNPLARSHGPHPSLDGETLYIAHDTGDELTGIDTETGDIDLSVPGILRAEEAIATRFGNLLWVVVARRRHGQAHRSRQPHHYRIGRRGRAARIGDAHAFRAHAGGQHAGNARRLSPLSIPSTSRFAARCPIAGAGTFGDLAVITNNGRHVFATFDAGASGTGGVAVVDVHRGEVVATWAYPALAGRTGSGIRRRRRSSKGRKLTRQIPRWQRAGPPRGRLACRSGMLACPRSGLSLHQALAEQGDSFPRYPLPSTT